MRFCIAGVALAALAATVGHGMAIPIASVSSDTPSDTSVVAASGNGVGNSGAIGESPIDLPTLFPTHKPPSENDAKSPSGETAYSPSKRSAGPPSKASAWSWSKAFARPPSDSIDSEQLKMYEEAEKRRKNLDRLNAIAMRKQRDRESDFFNLRVDAALAKLGIPNPRPYRLDSSSLENPDNRSTPPRASSLPAALGAPKPLSP
ncbi:hypothetical protein BC835DRAFT_1411402 [Cytidiella melzeri]|nr:hypothetical protein BC835DRAFT_1411402 [Cytidiella melzeri]